MSTITPEDLQAYAERRLATLRTRAADYLAQALLKQGTENALTLARMIDSAANEAAGLHYLADACEELGRDQATGDIIDSAWRDTVSLLIEQAHGARSASIPARHHAAAAAPTAVPA